MPPHFLKQSVALTLSPSKVEFQVHRELLNIRTLGTLIVQCMDEYANWTILRML